MKVLIDTNIILDLILQREQVDVASKLIALLRNQNHEIYMTEGGFYGMIYTDSTKRIANCFIYT